MTYSITNLPPLTGTPEDIEKGRAARVKIIQQLDEYLERRARLGSDYADEVERIRPIMYGAVVRQTDAFSWVVDGMSCTVQNIMFDMMTEQENVQIEEIRAELHGATVDEQIDKQRAAQGLPPLPRKEREELVVGVELWPALKHHGWTGKDTHLEHSPDRSRVRSVRTVYRRPPPSGTGFDQVIVLTCPAPTLATHVAFNGKPVTDADELWRIVTDQDTPDRSAYPLPATGPDEPPF